MVYTPVERERPIRWGIAARLFAMLALLGAAAVLVTGGVGYMRAREALETSVRAQLEADRHAKARQIEVYFRTVRNNVQVLAASRMVIEATRAMREAVDELNALPMPAVERAELALWYESHIGPVLQRMGAAGRLEDFLPVSVGATLLQHAYIVKNPHPGLRRDLLDDAGDGSRYSALHAIHHPILRAAAETLGFGDFMIADARNSRLIYATDKEIDFGTSLQIGPYRSSPLAAAVARCAGATDRTTICFADFSPYAPAAGEPTAFVAAPVFDGGVVTGVLVAQLSDEEIDGIVTGDRRWRQEGFGAHGEAYMVGPDALARSGLRLFYENRDAYFAAIRVGGASEADVEAIRTYGSPVLVQRLDTPAVRAALGGVEGFGRFMGYYGREVIAAWGPVSVFGQRWALVARMDVEEAYAPVARLQNDLMIVGAGALLLVLLAGGWLARGLLGPLLELTAGVRRFAAGDYAARVQVRSADEVGRLCVAFNGMVDDLREKNAVIEARTRENEQLLLNVLPEPVADRLRQGEARIADGFAEVTVLFADLVGFTQLSARMPPDQVVSMLNGLFSRFDDAARELGIEKIKTIGDAYMAVCGLPEPRPDHVERMMRMAIRMVHIAREHALEHRIALPIRIGLNAGPVVAGVIGKSKYIYDLWGDTVNLASRMESGGLADAIQVTRPVVEAVGDKFAFVSRGTIEVKGKGQVEAWLLQL